MAKVEDNLVIRGLSGRLGRQVVIRRLRNGRTLVCASPDFSGRILSAKQEEHHLRFRLASAYARAVAGSQPVYARLAVEWHLPAYNIALSDWFHPPVVHAVEVARGRIRVSASDNVCVARVEVSIHAADGEVLEEGQASQAQGLWWQYTPSAPLQPGQRVQARAWDLAGNGATLEREV